MRRHKTIRTIFLALALAIGGSALAVQPADASTPYKIQVNAQGDLTVTGDNNTDHVEVRTVNSTTWEVRVTNGAWSTVKQFTRNLRNITLNLKGGGDTVLMNHLDQRINNLTINLGNGHNHAELAGIDVDGRFRLTDGHQGTEIRLTALEVKRQATIGLGRGPDTIRAIDNRWEGKVKVTGTEGFDLSGSGEMFLGGLDVKGGSKRDLIAFDANTFFDNKPATIKTGGGNDLVLFKSPVHLYSPMTIRLGSGADVANIMHVRGWNKLSVFGDGGNDRFNIAGGIFVQTLTINGGGGTDALSAESTSFSVPARIISVENQ